MDINEAYRILGAARNDDENTIKKKYKRLLFLHHPDSKRHRGENPDDTMAMRIIEAYKVIRQSSDSEYDQTKDDWDFEAAVNEKAFSNRNVYVQYRIYDDEDLPLSKVAEGKYIWDPDLEDFPFFTKSVFEAAKDAIEESSKVVLQDILMEVFHLMMQEYVFPADAARKLGELIQETTDSEKYQFYGYIKEDRKNKSVVFHDGEPVEVFLSENKAVVHNPITGMFLGEISFDDDALYYVVLPLLEEPNVEVSAQMKRLIKTGRNKNSIMISISLNIPKELKDVPVAYTEQIQKALWGRGYRSKK